MVKPRRDVNVLEIVNQEEMIPLLRLKVFVWAKQEANDGVFECRYLKAKWSFIKFLMEEL